MKVIVAGSRWLRDAALVEEAIRRSHFPVSEVVCGASRKQVRDVLAGIRLPNADILGALWAIDRGLPVKYFPPDWPRFGDNAGPIRNGEMAAYAEALVLLWDGESKGSKSMHEQGERYGLLEYVFPLTLNVQSQLLTDM